MNTYDTYEGFMRVTCVCIVICTKEPLLLNDFLLQVPILLLIANAKEM